MTQTAVANYHVHKPERQAFEMDTQDVVVFDHTVRIDDPDADRKSARNVHSERDVGPILGPAQNTTDKQR